jgi:RNA polymerase sigma-70 factor, ECF subfamily
MEWTVKKSLATFAVSKGPSMSMSSVRFQQIEASALGRPITRWAEFDDRDFLARLRRGEPQAYRLLIRQLHGSLTCLATSIVGSRAQAEEVVQDTWLAVFSGIGAFRGHSSLSTWVFSIVLNRARTRATREARLIGLSALMEGARPGGAAVDVSESNAGGHLVEPRRLWDEISPERIVAGRQLCDHIMEAIDLLPAGQRAVFILRDIEGYEAEDTCALLGIIAATQRLWLHRARSRIRRTIDDATGSLRHAATGTAGDLAKPPFAGPQAVLAYLAPLRARDTVAILPVK